MSEAKNCPHNLINCSACLEAERLETRLAAMQTLISAAYERGLAKGAADMRERARQVLIEAAATVKTEPILLLLCAAADAVKELPLAAPSAGVPVDETKEPK